jgi:hypothetical protein
MDRPRAAFVLEEPDEERQADGKQGGQLTERMVAALDGGHDAFPKVVGISAHGRISSWAYPVVFYSVCHACVNRSKSNDNEKSLPLVQEKLLHIGEETKSRSNDVN